MHSFPPPRGRHWPRKMLQKQLRATRRRQAGGPVVLIVCDGWGVGATEPVEAERQGNAVARARTPVRKRMLRRCSWSLLRTSGEAVGLPAGQMGNSEVGHLNLGAGRVAAQDVTRIDQAVADGRLAGLPALKALADALRSDRGRLHLVGLCSDGGVHSHARHLRALMDWADGAGLPARVHCITDGRDASPTAGLGWVRRIERWAGTMRDGRVVSLSGRHYAMDRDRRWRRTKRAYRAVAGGFAPRVASASRFVEERYGDTSDEFLPPVVVAEDAGGGSGREPPGVLPGDGLLFFNFRADRMRQLASALADEEFLPFRRSRPPCRNVAAMTRYWDDPRCPALFPPSRLPNVLGETLARAGRTQLRMAETEKYAHVTYFFNGGQETPFAGEEREMTPSPDVETYDLKPEMSAPELTDALLGRLDERRHDFVLVNYANADMVGHTGNVAAAARAVEAVDRCVGRVLERVAGLGGTALVTADHGNAERMRDAQGQPFTAHTAGPVRLFLAVHRGNGKTRGLELRDGVLADVAPTVLQLMNVPQPSEMTGSSLLGAAPAPGAPRLPGPPSEQ